MSPRPEITKAVKETLTACKALNNVRYMLCLSSSDEWAHVSPQHVFARSHRENNHLVTPQSRS